MFEVYRSKVHRRVDSKALSATSNPTFVHRMLGLGRIHDFVTQTMGWRRRPPNRKVLAASPNPERESLPPDLGTVFFRVRKEDLFDTHAGLASKSIQ